MNRDELVARTAAGERFDYLMFWGHTAKGPELGPHVLSQWWVQPFEVDGQRYASAEHYMMAGKARLFGDDERLAAILASDDPREAKALGRLVVGFDKLRWAEHRVDIVVAANLGKFGHHPELAAYLLSTAPQVLVEASPSDRIWGIGLGATDPAAREPANWCGANLLGFALMTVRERLAAARLGPA